MLGAVATAAGIEFLEVPLPTCPSNGVLIDVHICGICGSDLLFASGVREPPMHPLGHELVGTVRELGAESAARSTLRLGQRVVVNSVSHCGSCDFCRVGRGSLCVDRVFVPQAGPGGLSPIAVAHVSSVISVPEGLTDSVAALIEPFAVALHAVSRVEGVPERILVIGAGTTGLAAVQCARRRGVEKVDVVARHPQQQVLAADFGAEVVNAPDAAADDYDQVLVTVPGDGLDLAIAAAARGTTVVTTAGYSTPLNVSLRSLVSKELNLTGAICADVRELTQVAAWLADGSLDARPLVTHTFDLPRIREAFAVAANKASGSVKVQVRAKGGHG